MATKKSTSTKSKASAKQIEDIANKSVDDISSTIISTQNKIRESLSVINEAMVQKQDELNALIVAIESKSAELEEITEKEKVSQDINQFKYDLEEQKKAFEHKINILKGEYKDKEAELAREHERKKQDFEHQAMQVDRERKLKFEDEDRERDLDFKEREWALQNKEAEFSGKMERLENLDAEIESETQKRVQAIKRDIEYSHKSKELELQAEIKILNGQLEQMADQNLLLNNRLKEAESAANKAAERANAIAIASLDKESGKAALNEIRSIAQKQAESKGK